MNNVSLSIANLFVMNVEMLLTANNAYDVRNFNYPQIKMLTIYCC